MKLRDEIISASVKTGLGQLFSPETFEQYPPYSLFNSEFYCKNGDADNIREYMHKYMRSILFRPSSKKGMTTVSMLINNDKTLHIPIPNEVLREMEAAFLYKDQEQAEFVHELLASVRYCVNSGIFGQGQSNYSPIQTNFMEKLAQLSINESDSDSNLSASPNSI